MRSKLKSCLLCALYLACLLLPTAVDAQTVLNWLNTDPGGGNWNTPANWDLNDVPFSSLGDIANIGNGGTAFVDGLGGAADAAGLTLGNGTLEVRSGGNLAIVDGNTETGNASVGSGSTTGTLDIQSGGIFSANTLSMAGDTDSAVNLAGTGSITINGDADLFRTTRITGNTGSFTVTGDLELGGNLVAGITNASSHTPINVGGSTTLGGDLTLDFSGVNPTGGSSWRLVSGSSGVTGSFSSIQGPELGAGLGYTIDSSGGNVDVEVREVLSLTVNRATGAATIIGSTSDINIELYAIGSPAGELNTATWQSLDSQNFDSANATWRANPPTPDGEGKVYGLAEAVFPLGSSTISSQQQASLGSILNTDGIEFGEVREDFNFRYLEPGDTTFTNGNVEYVGPHNNLVLVVDPTTGQAAIENQSVFDVEISLYSIASDSGSLVPDNTGSPANWGTPGVGWDSFDETGVDGDDWQRGPGTNSLLVEVNASSDSSDISTLLPAGSFVNIGTPFDNVSGTQDLEFNFFLEQVSGNPDGDYNSDGTVDLADYTAWRNNLGAPEGTLDNDPNSGSIGAAQYDTWKSNFGATGGSGVFPVSMQGVVEYGTLPATVSSAELSAVPEPSTLFIVAAALASMSILLYRQ